MSEPSIMTNNNETRPSSFEQALRDYRPSNNWMKASSNVRYVSELKDNRVFTGTTEAAKTATVAIGAGR